MDTIKIIGLPVPVSERGHRIVIDENIRRQYGIPENCTVLMEHTASDQIRIIPSNAKPAENRIRKFISAGRFNLPKEWVEANHIKIGSFVHLVLTDIGILVCPNSLCYHAPSEVPSWC
ncbi:AbrB/MazE/SpoVT family DNA-binding domain-containing protein [Caproicibacter fermentans]|uniref:AbrB/MazE/SpoVT family DNA-binding domain-containing protein n=1 Tax=Caproicibacter fermentans TaxID=2576756 RepID=A0A7G8TD82_9FIRM|nr:AbrB/MazE/SpoVT family DNA-binding domain-containing protein [Caproicibacter fermentans]QNK41573.1 AbrB/MazE/SpoVT family DNA-binding domain-containing protein [Caproicibacter fermentans]